MALAGVAARVFNAGVMFLTQVLFARVLGVSEFGIYATANTIMLLVAGFATLGLVAMPQRFWPEYESAGQDAYLRGLARFASWAPLLIGSGLALGGAGLTLLMRDILSPPVATATCVALLTIPALASLDVVEGIALTKAWKGLAYGLAFVVRPMIVPLVFALAWLGGVKPDSTLAVASLVIATWIAALLLLILVRRKLRHALPKGPFTEERGRWIKAGLPVMLIDGAFMLMTSTDILLMSLYQSDAAVGIYSAAARLVALVAFVHSGLTWASAHHFSHLHQTGDVHGLAAYAAKTTIWTFLPSLGAALIIALAAPVLLMLFGRDFQGGGVVTAILLLGLLARAAVGPAEQLLVMTDNQNACAYAYGWAFVVNLGFCLALIPHYGGLGAAASTAIAYLAASIIIAREVRLRLGFDVDVLSVIRRKRHGLVHA